MRPKDGIAFPDTHLDQCPSEGEGIHPFTISGMEAESRLVALGGSHLELNGTSIDVRPPLAFQVLLALALEPSQSLGRAALGTLLFGHLDTSKRGAQVRLVVKRLRHCLDQHECAKRLLRSSDSSLSLAQPLAIDAEVILKDQATLDRLDLLSTPILPGHASRFAAKYRNQVKGRVEVSLEGIWSSLDSQAEVALFVGICERLRDNFLLSAPIRSYLCASYKRLHRFEELTREIQAFDCEWLDAFGQCDRPDIGSLCDEILLGGAG